MWSSRPRASTRRSCSPPTASAAGGSISRCTWASPTPARRKRGAIRSVVALGRLLAQGIGDTIRISYAADPIHEVEDGKELLQVLGLRPRTEPELIACPTCGRIEIDLISMMSEVRRRLAEIPMPVKVAVMGCVVNGPGEARGQRRRGLRRRSKGRHLRLQQRRRPEQVATVPESTRSSTACSKKCVSSPTECSAAKQS